MNELRPATEHQILTTPEAVEYRFVYPVEFRVDGYGKVTKLFATLADQHNFLNLHKDGKKLHRRKEWVLV